MRIATAVLVLAVTMGGCSSRETAASGADEHREAPTLGRVTVRMVTTAGNIDLELDGEKAPIGVANFLAYARRGDYGGTVFHRTVPGFVIQGGGMTSSMVELSGDAPIKNEWKNGLKNARGTIGWARDEGPDTATRQWYINLSDNVKLDSGRPVSGNAGYAVFGHVIAGMEVVDRIAEAKTYDLPERDMKNVPIEPVMVLRVEELAAKR